MFTTGVGFLAEYLPADGNLATEEEGLGWLPLMG
jgi:hypothetical protein